MHGTERWYTCEFTQEELEWWAGTIRGCGASEAWVYFNNTREACASRNARQAGFGRLSQ